MLATQDIPLREHSHLDVHSNNELLLDDRLCPGCKKSAVNEHGGLVVAFGQSFFHVDCFKCAKCRNQVTADTNLLLLSDGSPICANCSYSCNICRLPILDEAIMTGDDSYHAHCFKCKVCSKRIDELVFAKTSQGIYCMNCHNERMIKIRKHAQKKAERERANGGSGSSRSREAEARNFHREQESRTTPHKKPSSSRLDSSRPPEAARSPGMPYVSDAFDPAPPIYSSKSQDNGVPSAPPSSFPSRSPSVTVAPPEPETQPVKQPNKSNTLPVPPPSDPSDTKRRSSYDDGVRPLNVLLRQDSRLADSGNSQTGVNGNPEGLAVTSRRDKRRSINPGLSLPSFIDLPSSQSSNLSPRNGTFGSQDQRESQTPPFLTAIDQSQFPISSSRPPSRAASINSTQSPTLYAESEQYRSRSRSSSIRANSYDHDHDDTIVMTSPPSMTVELEAPMKISTSIPSPRFSSGSQASATLSPTDANFDFHKRGSNASKFSLDRPRSGTPSRSLSPAYRADVPHSIESGTDTDNDTDPSSSDHYNISPPQPPPKDAKHSVRPPAFTLSDTSVDANASQAMHPGEMSDDLGESTVEQTSHTTFIAPALPPIRFSMNTADFSELLSSVNGLPPLKSLDSMAKRLKQLEDVPSTPPPTASSPPIFNESTSITSIAEEESQLPKSAMSLTPSDDSTATANGTLSPSNSLREPSKSTTSRQAEPDVVIGKLREAVNSAKENGTSQLQVDINFADVIIDLLESRSADFSKLKSKVDGMNRESKRFIDGMTVAQAEYDQELKARRDAEAEVTRLRVLLSGQAVRLTTLSGDHRRNELRQQMTKEISDNLSGLEHDLSLLKVERDMTLAEVEELSTKKTPGALADAGATNLGRSLTKRLENIRTQYEGELVPLTEKKEKLNREIAELKAVRDVFLEETTVLNARNEELAQLSAVYTRRIENGPETSSKPSLDISSRASSDAPRVQPSLIAPSLSTSTNGSSTIVDDGSESKHMRIPKSDSELHTTPKGKFKWMGSKTKENAASPASNFESTKSKAHIEHNFQQLSVLRFARCDHCGEKMWGSQLRCTICATSIHVRCIANVQIPCTHQSQHTHREEPSLPMLPSMFGRDLTEQVLADSKDEERQVPVIVEKCIEAVEERALDYEGIYRKTGGLGQTKAITQMFERGDYDSFDLCDFDRFNDICSVTSVLKTYFRSLPVPLLTFDLHDQFMAAIAIRDLQLKQKALVDTVNMLPNEHYYTLRMLMLHLNRVCELHDKNLMTGRNLGVVFGPTLMRSRDLAAEFSDMAGKALFVEWLVENAPSVFNLPE